MTLADAPPPYAAVVFDCDSTLSSIEGIEELASLASRHEHELRDLTTRAMDGDVPLEAVYGRRLELVRPARTELDRVGERYVATALPNARALVQALRALGKEVHIVSGGVLPAVAILGEHLGIEPKNVQAVDLYFDSAGEYTGFDYASPLARAGGKIEVLRALLDDSSGSCEPLALVGDGATDLEAGHLAARFIAFGGVERREAVFDGASIHATDPDFASLVPLLLSPAECEHLASLPEHAPLIDAARTLR